MLENSGAILNLAISVAVLAVATFLCLTLFHLFVSLKRINKISSQIKKIVDKTEGLVNLTTSKIKQSGTYLFLFSKLADRAMSYFENKTSDKKEEDKKNKK